MNTPTYPKVLLNHGFLWLWVGQLLSQLADRIFIYTLMIMAYSLTGTLQGVSVPMLAFGIPSVLFGSIAGVFVDRWDRKTILVVSDFLRGLLLLIPFLRPGNSLLELFFVAFVVYTITQFFAPAESASIPDVVPARDLLAANSMFLVTWMLANVIGFGLGAPIVNAIGDHGALILSTVLYVLSGCAVLLSPIPSRSKTRGALWNTVFADLFFGFRYIFRQSTVRISLFKLFMSASGIAVVSVLALGYAKDILHIGEKNFGYLIIAAGIGMVIGMPTLTWIGRWLSRGWTVVIGFLTAGTLFALMATFTTLPTALVIIFGLGVTNIWISASLQTILQEKVSPTVRGRVFGAQNMLMNSAFTIPPYLFAAIADSTSVLASLWILAGALFLVGVAGLFLPHFQSS